jgi:hypothetical protein
MRQRMHQLTQSRNPDGAVARQESLDCGRVARRPFTEVHRPILSRIVAASRTAAVVDAMM